MNIGILLILFGFTFTLSRSYACDLAAIDKQTRAIGTTLLQNDSFKKLELLKEIKHEVSNDCPDVLDTLTLTLEITGVQIGLGTELLEAENQLLELEKKIIPLKEYYRKDYNKILGQLMSLHIKSSRHQLAKFYAKRLLNENNLKDNEVRLDALAITSLPTSFVPSDDLKKIVKQLNKKNPMFKTSLLSPYRPSNRFLLYLQRQLELGKYEELIKNTRELNLSNYINKKTTYVSDNLFAIALTREVAELQMLPGRYSLPNEINEFSMRKRTNLSLENQLIINLLKVFDEHDNRKLNLDNAIKTFHSILSSYDYGRKIQMSTQLSLTLASLLNSFPKDENVKQTVFFLSQHLFISNPVAPVLKLNSESKNTYKKLVIKQQALTTQLSEKETGSFELIKEIAKLSKKLKGITRTTPKTVKTIQSQLKHDETLLYGVELGATSALFTLSSNKFELNTIETNDLKSKIVSHREALTERKNARKTGESLYSLVGIKKIHSNNLLFISYGSLEMLPISTLYNFKTKKWLVEEKSISRMSTLDRLGRQNNEVKGTNNRIAISDPIFYLPPPPNFKLLPHYEIQNVVMGLEKLPDTLAESIALLGQQSSPPRLSLTKEDAIEAKVKRELNKRDWNFISFSTHTIFPSEETHILYPGLALSIDFEDLSNDSILQANEIADMKLTRSTVLLAACNTAKASEVGGSFNSLITSFQFAGAKSVIASQWKVDSKETYAFMSSTAEFVNSGTFSFESAIRRVQFNFAHDLSNQTDSASVWGAWEVYF
ncbi:CHAT domain-containing protein [Shewanella sp. AS16]|uniref:CHAT domain-containing protein n=1 Tax=Shewanella sp. AS16 TaxID=2907625 RepID=UPI001F16CE21|nr:CHAT domain-containing protein [Shewanella sp. AS16]MCE9688262.1 CHAT domain-containing protein [Shewanella sp. AS16]